MKRITGAQLRTPFVWIQIALLAVISLARGATEITFDDLSPATNYIVIPHGYAGGLQWFGFGALNGSLQSTNSGYYSGTISASNVAFNLFNGAPTITYSSRFNLNSAYLTAES